jgi:hypothetical protein
MLMIAFLRERLATNDIYTQKLTFAGPESTKFAHIIVNMEMESSREDSMFIVEIGSKSLSLKCGVCEHFFSKNIIVKFLLLN